MLLKTLIDQIFRDSNGGLTRDEIRTLVNTYQNHMLGRNCNEMRADSTLTVASVDTYPEYLETALTDRGTFAGATAYHVGDVFLTGSLPGSGNSYFRVEIPFTSVAWPAAQFYADLANNCSPLTAENYSALAERAVAYRADSRVEATSTTIVKDDGSTWIAVLVQASPAVFTGVWETDRALWKFVPRVAAYSALGELTVPVSAIPEYLEIEGIREVVWVGVLDSNKYRTTTYTPRIQQSTDPSIPTRVYTDGLPEDTVLNYEGYRWPVQVTGVSSPLEVPVAHQQGLLTSLCMRHIETSNQGASVYWEDRVDREWKDWMNYINRSLPSPREPVRNSYNRLAG